MKTIVWQVLRVSHLQTWASLSLLILSIVNPLSAPLTNRTTLSEMNPIQRENELPGTSDWQLSHPAGMDEKMLHFPAIEGYAWTTSTLAGDEVKFSVSTTSSSFSADIYRMGWYQGKGGRLVESISGIQGHIYPLPSPDSDGLIECTWPIAFEIKTDLQWVSGMYMVKLTALNGEQSYISFVLRSSRPSVFAFIHAVNTDEAYNLWGGRSLYHDINPTLKAVRAFKVSFDRPFIQDTGAGLFFWFEYPMVRWLEQNGYDLDYLSDPDLQGTPNLLQDYHAILIVGHSEYWSQQMRVSLERAVNKGVNLAVFAANDIYWQIRYEQRTLKGQSFPMRTIVCFKSEEIDPLSKNRKDQTTVQFRQDPLDRPEQMLLGSMQASNWDPKLGGFPWVVADASNWIFIGTGLRNNDSLPGLVGYEYDKVFSNYPVPNGLQILTVSPVVDQHKIHDISNATLYTAGSGARVFNAGTFEWSWGLDSNSSIEKSWSPGSKSSHPSLVNKSAQKITTNILQNFSHITNTTQGDKVPQSHVSALRTALPYFSVILSLLFLVLCYWYCSWIWHKKSINTLIHTVNEKGRQISSHRRQTDPFKKTRR